MGRKSLEYSAQQRAGMLVYWLVCGERLTVAEIAAKLELTERGTYSLLRNIARAVPLVCEDQHWQAAQNVQDAPETAPRSQHSTPARSVHPGRSRQAA